MILVFLLAVTGQASERCTSKFCDVLMIVLGCIGIAIVGLFVFFVVRHYVKAKKTEHQAYQASLVE